MQPRANQIERRAVQGCEDYADNRLVPIPAGNVRLAHLRADVVAERQSILQGRDVEKRQGETVPGTLATLAFEKEKGREKVFGKKRHELHQFH